MEDRHPFTMLNSICTRRKSVRNFSDRPLTDDQITAIRAIALTAPYASGKKNWELLVITDTGLIAELAGLVDEVSRSLGARVREDYSALFMDYARAFSAFRSAPALFIPVFRVQPSLSLLLGDDQEMIARWERDSYVKSIAGVIMLIQLAAESLGLGACCMTGPLLAEAEIARLTGLKRGFEIGAIIPVGWAS